MDHNGPKLEVHDEAGTLDHGGPKLEVDGEAGTLDHDGPKLKTWEEAEMENKEKPLGVGIEERVTDKEQLPGTGSCIFFDEKGKRMNTDKMYLVIAEKPSVSLAIAHVLGKYEKMNGYVQGKGFICSWCLSVAGAWDIWQSMQFLKPMIPGTGTGDWKICRSSRRNGR